jgi:alkylation response protein AidB-like acyl-CoA dehydrogenase
VVHLDLDDRQRDLQEGIRRFCKTRYPIPGRAAQTTNGLDRTRWAELAELGVFSLTVPESNGGLGLRLVEAAIVFEVLGGALVPGPLVASHVAATVDESVAAGRSVAALIDASDTARSQSPLVVDHLAEVDVAYVLRNDGISRFEPDSIAFELLPQPFDPSTPVVLIGALGAGKPVGDADLARRWRTTASLLVSAMLVGIADTACRLGTEYAKTREQFGRPIGSFQALQHMLADSHAQTELARAALYAAAASLDDPSSASMERTVAVARITAAKAAIGNSKTCIQVHGGMGFTWEVDAHLLLKRSWVLCSAYGSPDEAAETVARRLVAAEASATRLDAQVLKTYKE